MEDTPVTQMQEKEPPATSKSNRNLMIGIAAIVVLCCCCILIAGGIYGFNSTKTEEIVPLPTEIGIFSPPTEVEIAPPSDFGGPTLDQPPAGGLGNDILKQDTWNVMVPVAVGLGCDQPLGSESRIEVLQEPTSNSPGGVWKEKWTVVCQSGDEYPFEVEYILDASGATFNITPLP